MKLYPGSRCRFGIAEVYSDTSETLKQLERHTVIVSPEQTLKFLLIKTNTERSLFSQASNDYISGICIDQSTDIWKQRKSKELNKYMFLVTTMSPGNLVNINRACRLWPLNGKGNMRPILVISAGDSARLSFLSKPRGVQG